MRRLIGLLLLAAIVAFGTAWIANRQGELIYVIDGYQLTASAGTAIAFILLFAIAVMALTRVVRRCGVRTGRARPLVQRASHAPRP